MIESNPIIAIIVHELSIVYIEPVIRRILHRNLLLLDFSDRHRPRGNHLLALVFRLLFSSTHRGECHRVYRLAVEKNHTYEYPLLGIRFWSRIKVENGEK